MGESTRLSREESATATGESISRRVFREEQRRERRQRREEENSDSGDSDSDTDCETEEAGKRDYCFILSLFLVFIIVCNLLFWQFFVYRRV